MLAMAVACEPQLLIADEPTTALDVTVQVEVLELLRELQRDSGMGLLLITHDLGIVAQMADKVAVMYAGQIVEQAPVDAIFYATAHPYTEGLKRALPSSAVNGGAHGARTGLQAIAGAPPNLAQPPAGCGFYPRCAQAMRICEQGMVPVFELSDAHNNRCWLSHPQLSNHRVPYHPISEPQAAHNNATQGQHG
jgi:oligopeptide/dipeptide ABC transporter ATP-binding protein